MYVLNLPQFGKTPSGKYLESLKSSPQHNGSIFKNYGEVSLDMKAGQVWKMLKPYWNKPKDATPQKPIEIRDLDPTVIDSDDSSAHLTWFGHSAFLLEMEGKVILLDPMFGPAAAPFEFQVQRFEQKLPLEVEAFPQIDYVIYSHDHYDHLDYPTILKLKDRVGHFYVPLGLKSHLLHWGVEDSKITELDWWDELEIDGITLTCTPAQHFSGRGVTDRSKTLWASWVLKGKQNSIYFSGDSGYFGEFKKIGEKYGPFDIALMECGQYNELWHAIHMMPEETAQAGIDVQAKAIMPIHWGMFDLSLHSWTEPVERVSVAAAKLNLPLVTPVIGERFDIQNLLVSNQWWN
ncbi:MAG: MBL fold metallo-hydrolase [Flavobacteriales bacterium]|nr:MBL fold metallo-hydrolase [Flavobacteriales bacterium]NCG30846.1 MBL fold metallo-hydrolase [Bacteroidota bacterium]MBT3962991.1 MBL fold metallo-hydrolase [Flavobacteriales bacterium]MBT4703953.1 MBL fold metallo-hydrolase [Flavobacteriales bacterium]MBT4930351.1 MBL fold metallo-hydrolase [Flavobacteriales bacterium]